MSDLIKAIYYVKDDSINNNLRSNWNINWCNVT